MKTPSSEVTELINRDIDSLYFQSNKLVFEDGKVYSGQVGRVKKEEIINDFTMYKLVITPELWRELPFMFIVKKT